MTHFETLLTFAGLLLLLLLLVLLPQVEASIRQLRSIGNKREVLLLAMTTSECIFAQL